MPEVERTHQEHSTLSIREVLDALVEEFPDVTISKIRFLESRGLIQPDRTPSGYRKFDDATVDRLRWILRQQREHFLPLKVIKGRLDRENGPAVAPAAEPSLFDSFDHDPGAAVADAPRGDAVVLEPPAVGEDDGPAALAPPVVSPPATPPAPPLKAEVRRSPEGASEPTNADAVVAEHEPRRDVEEPTPVATTLPSTARARTTPAPSTAPAARRTATGLSAADLTGVTGCPPGLVAELEEYGLIRARTVGGVRCYDEEAIAITQIATAFGAYGIEPRHLSSMKRAADRQASLFGQVVGPLLRQRNPTARERAQDELDELARLGGALHDAFLRAVLRDSTGV